MKESFLFWGMAIKLRHNKLSPRLELSHFMQRQNNSTDDIFGLFLSKVGLLFMSWATFGCPVLFMDVLGYLRMSVGTFGCLGILLDALSYFWRPAAIYGCLGLLMNVLGYFCMPWATF